MIARGDARRSGQSDMGASSYTQGDVLEALGDPSVELRVAFYSRLVDRLVGCSWVGQFVTGSGKAGVGRPSVVQ